MIIKSISLNDFKYLITIILATFGLKKLIVKGNFTYGNPKVVFDSVDYKVKIGKYCSIGKKVTFILSGAHKTDFISTFPLSVFLKNAGASSIIYHKGDINVGNDVWIGYGAIIMPGITIGDGAIIGAMSVVTKNVNPYEIVAGNPARVIRTRFNEKEIERLLKIKWWNWDTKTVSENAKVIASSNIQKLSDFKR